MNTCDNQIDSGVQYVQAMRATIAAVWCVLQGVLDDVALHKVDIDDICKVADTLAASSGVEIITAKAHHLAARFRALTSSLQVL